MKKVFFLAVLTCTVFLVNAQKYDEIKNQLLFKKYQQAKTDLDKNWSNAKFTSKPEAHILRSTIYGGLALDESNKNTAAGEQLLSEAAISFKKYQELDPAMALLSDPIYQDAGFNLYSGYYAQGYNDYTNKKWEAAYEKFKKAEEISVLLMSKNIIPTSLDTNIVILAGITAENAEKKDEAAKYYIKLADAKVTGEGFESVYRFLVNYYFGRKDITNFEKYKSIGQQLFPSSEYFTYDKIDFAVGLEETFEAKIKALEAMLATDPNNYKANQILGELIYDTLNPRKEGGIQPANAEELEKRMVIAFNKSATAKPGSEISYLFIGDHFINKAVRINEAREAFIAEMKKKGPTPSKEDAGKKDQMDKTYSAALEGALAPYESAAAIFKDKPASTDKNQAMRDKQQYKKVVSYLADIYANKKLNAKGKPADIAKFAAEEKKWNELYDTIR